MPSHFIFDDQGLKDVGYKLILADEVAAHVFGAPYAERLHMVESMGPLFRLPFPRVFIEFRPPNRFYVDKTGQYVNLEQFTLANAMTITANRLGLTAEDVEKLPLKALDEVRKTAKALIEGKLPARYGIAITDVQQVPAKDVSNLMLTLKSQGFDNTGLRIYLINPTVKLENGEYIEALKGVIYMVSIDQDGKIYTDEILREGDKVSKQELSFISERYSSVLDVSFMVIGLLNCRNIELIERDARGKRSRSPKPKSDVYHVLKVKPMGRRYAYADDPNPPTHKNRFHFRRGHFRTYGEPGLFGKYPGTYWFGPTTVGAIELGQVDKAYDLRREA